MTYGIRSRSTCRVCNAASPEAWLHFARMPLTDDLVSADRRGAEFLADLTVYYCPACGLTQTLHDVDMSAYYREYGYTVSASPFAQRFMQRLAEACVRRVGLRVGDRVLEIGCGDGFQLACFRELGAHVFGIEPSTTLAQAAIHRRIDVRIAPFDDTTATAVLPSVAPFQLILLTYTFDHLAEPLAALQLIRRLLDPERGALVIEVHDLDQIIGRRETCLFEHEHTVYMNAASLARTLARAGFRVVAEALLPKGECRGNSLLVAAAPASAPPPSAPPAMPRPTFHADVQQTLTMLRQYVRQHAARGQRIAGYGAGGRGVMTLAQAGLSVTDIPYVCDRNCALHGFYTPASHIPVVPPQCLLDDPPQQVIVFSYGYLPEIRAAWPEYEAHGGRFVSLLDLLQ